MSEDDVRMGVLAGVARQARGSQPTAKWLKLWHGAIAPLSPEEVRAWCRLQWELALTRPTDEGTLVASFWGMAAVPAPGLPALLADWAWRLHKSGQHRIAGAAIQAIGMLATGKALPDDAQAEDPVLADEAIGQLQRLKSRIRHRATTRRIDHALGAVAAARDLGLEALQDLVVEDADLGPDGSRVWAAGAYDLYLFLTEDGDIELATFERASGRAMGAPPKAVRNDHFGVLNEAKAIQKVLAETLATQKHRLEAALENQRAWPLLAWRQVFGRHPLMRHLAMRLVWSLWLDNQPVATATFNGTDLIDVQGNPLHPAPDTELKLAHPALLDAETLRHWQRTVVLKRLIQPFKQAFREVYRPLPADESLRRSERFAGVVVRHRQMYALLRGRGWSGLGGIGPMGYLGLKELPGEALTAVLGFRQFRHYPDRQRRQVTLAGIEFLPNPLPDRPAGTDLRVPLADLGPIAYSETMRDLALVVGVAGLGTEDELRDEPDHHRRHVPEALLGGQIEMRASLVRELLPYLGLSEHVTVDGAKASVVIAGRTFTLNLATGDVIAAEDGRPLDMDGIERADTPLYLPFEGGDAPTTAILATLLWLGKFGRSYPPGAS